MSGAAVGQPVGNRRLDAAGFRAERLVLGLGLVGIGAVWFLHGRGVDVAWSVVPPAGLLLVGVALLVLAALGRSGSSTLAWWGAVLLVVSVGLGLGADRYVAPAGDVAVAPRLEDWPVETRRSAGNVDVDLTSHPLPSEGRVDVHVGAGDVTVVVPAAVHVTVEVGTGTIRVDGRRVADGMDLSWVDERPARPVVVAVDVAAGQVEVRHV